MTINGVTLQMTQTSVQNPSTQQQQQQPLVVKAADPKPPPPPLPPKLPRQDLINGTLQFTLHFTFIWL
jgi:hypothetical protein